MGKVLCCGSIVADILVRPVAEPGWGQTTWVDNVALHIGGNGANTSYTLGRLGTPVWLAGSVGQDDVGYRLLNELRSVAVDVFLVSLSESLPTPASVVLVHPDGRRAILQQPGASRKALDQGIEFTESLVESCSRLHLANIFALPSFLQHAPAALRQAHTAGLTTSMDTGWDAQGRWMQTLEPCLPHTDLLFVNETEAPALTGCNNPEQAARLVRDRGPRVVVVKLGRRGCLVVTERDCFHSPAFDVKTVDTTGAGDCFCGGFLSALERGFDLLDAARFANAVGACSVGSLGSVTGIKTFQETLEWMRHEPEIRTTL